MISVLTPTGGRSESFAKCVDQMLAQDYESPVRWVIVDDCEEAMHSPWCKLVAKGGTIWEILVVRPEPFWQPGQNTQARNLIAGLEHCGDRVIICEDDDYYAPGWIGKMHCYLNHNQAVGEAPGRYTHVNGQSRMMTNKTPSLCATAFKGDAMKQRMINVCTKHTTGIDARFWSGLTDVGIYPYSGDVIGIKGGLGRQGIGVGHKLFPPDKTKPPAKVA